MIKLCFASNNAHKLEEIREKLPEHILLSSLAEIGCAEELPENQDTLEGNALEKANFVWNNYGVNCFADDTGLMVEALNGEPGVYSARYAGPQKDNTANFNLVLEKLQNQSNRRAHFKTVIALIINGDFYEFEGKIEGIILKEPKGIGGFGYDSIFQPDGFSKTFAELSIAEKNQISHRAIAVSALLLFLKNMNI